MHPEIAKTLTEQRRGELTEYAAGSRRRSLAGPSWLSRHRPRWHVSWSRTVLPAAGERAIAGGGYPDRPGQRGSSLVIIVSAYR
jgi:hypothetical protein